MREGFYIFEQKLTLNASELPGAGPDDNGGLLRGLLIGLLIGPPPGVVGFTLLFTECADPGADPGPPPFIVTAGPTLPPAAPVGVKASVFISSPFDVVESAFGCPGVPTDPTDVVAVCGTLPGPVTPTGIEPIPGVPGLAIGGPDDIGWSPIPNDIVDVLAGFGCIPMKPPGMFGSGPGGGIMFGEFSDMCGIPPFGIIPLALGAANG